MSEEASARYAVWSERGGFAHEQIGRIYVVYALVRGDGIGFAYSLRDAERMARGMNVEGEK